MQETLPDSWLFVRLRGVRISAVSRRRLRLPEFSNDRQMRIQRNLLS
jgi:hypothetical protein